MVEKREGREERLAGPVQVRIARAILPFVVEIWIVGWRRPEQLPEEPAASATVPTPTPRCSDRDIVTRRQKRKGNGEHQGEEELTTGDHCSAAQTVIAEIATILWACVRPMGASANPFLTFSFQHFQEPDAHLSSLTGGSELTGGRGHHLRQNVDDL
jgi:hypothetical protein